MSDITKKDSNILESVAASAAGANIDGRGRNIVFKHKQLTRLFDCLKDYAIALLESLAEGCPATTARFAAELAHALKQISAVIERIPANIVKASAEYALLTDATRQGGVRRASAGTVVILGAEAHPFASWVVPLAAAIHDGNSAIISLPPSLAKLHKVLGKPLSLALDQDAFHLVCLEPSTVSQWISAKATGIAGVTSFGELPVPSSVSGVLTAPLTTKFRYDQIPAGPCAFVVDQSLLPDGQPLHPLDDGVSPVPHKLDQAAKALANALLRTGIRQDSTRSAGLPAFVLVHENVASLFTRALKRHLSPDCLQPHSQAIKGIEDILSAATPSKGLDYLPVFAVTSFDHALDLVQDRLPESFATYVFAAPRFGAYFANNSNVRLVCVNQVPVEVLVAGPYANADDFSHTVRRTIKFSKDPEVPPADQSVESASFASSQQALAKQLAALQVRPVKQVPGARIDFFGGSFLLAAGTFLSIVLGASGYGLYQGGKALLFR
ncbi:hypothetical protein NCC49_002622 [Naganishia albida]|nr:hypothetical protein NCC49_002622 [Naganishia albida]